MLTRKFFFSGAVFRERGEDFCLERSRERKQWYYAGFSL